MKERLKTRYPVTVSGGIATSFSGPWNTAVPGATTGIAFTTPAGTLRCQCDATAFNSVNATIEVQVYLDGVYQTSMSLASNINTGVRLKLSSAVFTATVAAGTHYVAFRLFTGGSDASDRGSIFGIVLPS